MNILLIHGLGRTPASMWSLAQFLRSHRHTPHHFGYWAWKNTYTEIVDQLRSKIIDLAAHGDYCIVGHSLGGLLSRSALPHLPQPRHVFMLGTPNQPPRLATLAQNLPIFAWLTQDCGLKLSQSHFYETLPKLTHSYTLIAGSAGPRGDWSPFGHQLNDGIVAVAETIMNAGDRPQVFPVFHTFMMNHMAIQQTILRGLNAID